MSSNKTHDHIENLINLNNLACGSYEIESYIRSSKNTIDRLTAERDELIKRLTPSVETKCQHIAEHKFVIEEYDDENEDYYARTMTVPWTTVKEIMSAIRTGLKNERGNQDDQD